MHGKAMKQRAIQNNDDGVKVCWVIVKDVKFADDQGMVSSTEKGLQRLMDGLDETAGKYDIEKSKFGRWLMEDQYK